MAAMTPEIHGHVVLEQIIAARRTFTRETLVAFIRESFGREARYHTCSAAGMDAAELVDFLAARGKFTGTPDAFTIDPARMCRH